MSTVNIINKEKGHELVEITTDKASVVVFNYKGSAVMLNGKENKPYVYSILPHIDLTGAINGDNNFLRVPESFAKHGAEYAKGVKISKDDEIFNEAITALARCKNNDYASNYKIKPEITVISNTRGNEIIELASSDKSVIVFRLVDRNIILNGTKDEPYVFAVSMQHDDLTASLEGKNGFLEVAISFLTNLVNIGILQGRPLSVDDFEYLPALTVLETVKKYHNKNSIIYDGPKVELRNGSYKYEFNNGFIYYFTVNLLHKLLTETNEHAVQQIKHYDCNYCLYVKDKHVYIKICGREYIIPSKFIDWDYINACHTFSLSFKDKKLSLSIMKLSDDSKLLIIHGANNDLLELHLEMHLGDAYDEFTYNEDGINGLIHFENYKFKSIIELYDENTLGINVSIPGCSNINTSIISNNEFGMVFKNLILLNLKTEDNRDCCKEDYNQGGTYET